MGRVAFCSVNQNHQKMCYHLENLSIKLGLEEHAIL
jgi:hypothetical protein